MLHKESFVSFPGALAGSWLLVREVEAVGVGGELGRGWELLALRLGGESLSLSYPIYLHPRQRQMWAQNWRAERGS